MEFDVALAFGGGDEVAPVVVAEAGGDGAHEHLEHGRARRGRYTQHAAGLDDEPGVLGRQSERELRGAIARVDRLDHAVEVEVGDAVGTKDPDRLLHRDPRLGCEREPFEADPSRGEGDEAVHQLHGVPEAQGSEVHERPSERLQHGSDARHRVVVAADHEREHPVLGSDRAAGERGLDQVVTGPLQSCAELAHHLGAVGREVDEDRAGGRGRDPLVGHLPHDGGRREREDRDLARRADRGDRRLGRRAFDRSRACGIDVEHHDFVAVGDQICGDMAADVPEPDDSDAHPVPPRVVAPHGEPGVARYLVARDLWHERVTRVRLPR